jgi:shikimate kinase
MVDLDERIAASEGKTPAQLINDNGESGFRSIESNTLRHLLEAGAASVIALGGGAWIEQHNRDVIDEFRCASVWLDVPFEMCWQRIEASSEERPLGKTRAEALERYGRRKPVYELAGIHIHVSPDETLEDLVTRIKNTLDTNQ